MTGSRSWQWLFWFVLLATLLREGSCVCYFPWELQGVWETQVTSEGFDVAGGGRRGVQGASLTFQNITIHSDAVLEWGVCHERVDRAVILADGTGVSQCFRCVSLRLVAAPVLQVWTPGLQTCYTSEEMAYQTCPTPAQIADKRVTLLMLYKRQSARGEPEVRVMGCPFDGRYTFTHERAGGAGGSCLQPTSEISNCPLGFGYNVTYRDCSFSTFPLSRGLQCLGSWLGEDGRDYLAVRDTSVASDQPHLPRYRCGMYEEEVGTARVYLALGNDTTCTNGLYSPHSGYETYILTSVPAPPLPPAVRAARCTFPRSLQGHWHHTYLGSDTALFRDYINHKTYSVSCVQDMEDGERYIVYARTHCGEWSYNCFWLKRRSANILEHILGLYPSETLDLTLCDVRNFGDRTSWITQARSLLEEPTTCPIVGRYTGELPDASGYCAELFSDCTAPNLMSFTVAECRNISAVYEQSVAGPTSEAGPWLPPEQQVSTGAVLTFTQDFQGRRRGRRQASGGQFRVANARTTTISWLWGTPAAPSTTTTITTTTTTTPTPTPTPTTSQPPVTRARFLPVPTWRRPLPPRPQEEKFPGQGGANTFSPSPPQPFPPFRNGHNPIGFWPNNPSLESRPLPPGAGVIGVPSPVMEAPPPPESQPKVQGVPGRATWVPGAPPGFSSPHDFTENNSSQESASGVPGPVEVPGPAGSPRLPVGPRFPAGQRTLKQEREYQCLGQWTEDNHIYALTFRRDIRTYECFVGVIRPDGIVFIKEAESEAGCSRNGQPEILGMKLQRREACPDGALRPLSRTPQNSQRSFSTHPTQRPTKPWEPITGRPRARGSSGVRTTSPSTSMLCLALSLSFLAAIVSLAGSS